MNISHSLCNILNSHQFQIDILAHIECFQEYLAELTSIKLALQCHLLKQIVFKLAFSTIYQVVYDSLIRQVNVTI